MKYMFLDSFRMKNIIIEKKSMIFILIRLGLVRFWCIKSVQKRKISMKKNMIKWCNMVLRTTRRTVKHVYVIRGTFGSHSIDLKQ